MHKLELRTGVDSVWRRGGVAESAETGVTGHQRATSGEGTGCPQQSLYESEPGGPYWYQPQSTPTLSAAFSITQIKNN
jgi:hypothetical protein